MNKVTYTFTIFDDKREEFMQAIRSINEQLKKEKGLIRVTLFQSVDNPCDFSLIEEWETQEDLDRHTRSELYRVLTGALKVLSEHSEIHFNLKSDRLRNRKTLSL